MNIELLPDPRPIFIGSRRIPHKLRKKVRAELNRMIEAEVIRPVNGTSDWCHPMLTADKKDGQVRVCIDPRHLNQWIKRPIFQLPDIDALMSELGGASYFLTLDLESGFWQIPVTESTSKLLTFATPFGNFQYLRLPYSVCSGPQEFHRRVVQAVAMIPGVLVYIDDIVIFAETIKEHNVRLALLVLKALKEAGFMLNETKCKYAQKRIKFLGHIVEGGKLRPNPDKIAAIKNFPTPTNHKELRSYLGLVGWLRKFHSDLMINLSVFRPLQKDSEPFIWTEAHSKAMTAINHMLSDELALELFEPGETLELWTDASPYGLGAVLLQNGRPLYCLSRSLTKAESNYHQIERELLGITWAFERLDAFAYGSKVQVYTDHEPFARSIQKTNWRFENKNTASFCEIVTL